MEKSSLTLREIHLELAFKAGTVRKVLIRTPRLILPFLLTLGLAAPEVVVAAQNGTSLPVSGRAVTELVPIERALLDFMREHNVQAGTMALAHRGQMVFARGYGWADQWKTRPISPTTRMRIASVSKVLTGAAVRKLIRDGKLSMETRVYDFLGQDVKQRPGADQRLQQITVHHLLRHQGGWDRKATFDPMFIDNRVRQAFGLSRPPLFPEIFRYMLTQPLQFDPGTRSEYSNFGYDVLGMVIEKAGGMSYDRYVTDNILRPVGASSIVPGRENIQTNEAWYDDPTAMKMNMASRTPSGGWIASAPDLCRVLKMWWISGEPRSGPSRRQSWLFFGSLPGTTSMVQQRRDGVDVAILLNKRNNDYEKFNDQLRRRISDAIDRVARWPEPNDSTDQPNTNRR